jgi:competence protein ComEC
VTFLDVGQGDSAVIEAPSGRVVVIDGGGRPGTDERAGADPGSRVVVPFLRRRGLSTVDLLVATHPDDDHVQGLIAVASRLNVRSALDSGYPDDAAPCQARLRRLLRSRGVPVYRAERGQTLDLGGGARLEVLNPPPGGAFLAGTRSDTNNASVVLRLTYGRARILFIGDAEAEAEQAMLDAAAPSALKADVLKVGHHGSRWSSSAPFLAAIRPSVAVISAGRSNNYNHPHSEVLDRLRAAGVRAVLRTDQAGAIQVETDGRTVHAGPAPR